MNYAEFLIYITKNLHGNGYLLSQQVGGPRVPITEDPGEEDNAIVEDPGEEEAPVEHEPGGDGEPEIDHKEPEAGEGSEEVYLKKAA